MPKAEGKPTTRRASTATSTQPTLQVEESADDWFVGLDDAAEDTNTLLYGREGSGKTTSALRALNAFPNGGRALVINAEGGLKKVALQKRGVDTSRITTWPKRGAPISHKGLLSVYDKVRNDLENDPNAWVVVVIDSATEVYQAILDVVQTKRVQGIKNLGKPVDEYHVDIADYGDMSKMFRDIMRKFRDLPCHVVFTALERRDVDKDTGKPQYGPAVTPGLQADLLGYVDFVLMCKPADEDGPFRALTRANSRYRAKDRFDVLPRVLAEPSMDRILGYLHGELTEEEDPFQGDLPSSAKTAQDKVVATDDDEDDEDTEETDTPAA